MVFHQVFLWRAQFVFGQDTSLYAPIAIVLHSDIDTALMPMALASVVRCFCAVKPSLNHSRMSCAQCVRFSSSSHEHSCFVPVLLSDHSTRNDSSPMMRSAEYSVIVAATWALGSESVGRSKVLNRFRKSMWHLIDEPWMSLSS